MRKLNLFLAAASLVLFAEKALCYETTFSIEPESFNFFGYQEMREQKAAPLSIRTGRFLSVDPDQWYAKQNGTDEEKREFQINLRRPQGSNRYSYTYSNPIRYTDPDGKVVLVDDAAIGVIILAAAGVAATNAYLHSPNGSDPSRTNAEVMGMQIKTAVTGMIGTLTSLAQNNRHYQEVATSQLAAAARELGKVRVQPVAPARAPTSTITRQRSKRCSIEHSASRSACRRKHMKKYCVRLVRSAVKWG